ncbi:efflux RND transporter periplasmic adaptor subunit [Paramagnetospirillum kuznetsovii]|uniref:Efflux RND transporter periplasmic adaptor subunit n=1 Tax=Paramagnetospirillum kuznetsovii TaxID=2053833 RepID=A0A364NT53_9PROT|nr:efflux RND transporter periplasmic adaptor subunit [Paramagnetospirillum kuznetsovii]RAU20269.1 efflux RND transporter periplasmic adaptor subunit [Paramagnetospirillum kuznetsovii]
MRRYAFAVVLAVLAASSASAQDMGRGGAGQDIRAQLSPRRFTTLSSELAAKVDRITVKDGERFKDGQALVSLDCHVQRAQLEEARATMVAAEKTYSVNRRLHEMNAGGALEAEVAAAEVAKNRAKINAGAAVVSKCNVAAPFPGRVVEIKVHDHQFVQAGQVMLEILDDSVLEVEFLAPSRWLSWLKPGLGFQIAIDETGRSYPAKVARLGAKVDPLSQSVKVVAEVTGTFPELLAGMSGRVLLTPP